MHTTHAKAVVLLIGLAALARLLPHPPNFTPVLAMALFAGSYIADRRLAVLVPLLAMVITDAVIGWHATLPYVYGALVVTVGIGMWMANRRTAMTVVGATLVGSLLFFSVTNSGVWVSQGLYPHNPAGLLACYVAALPFLQTSLLGDLFYAALLFGSKACWEQWMTHRSRTA